MPIPSVNCVSVLSAYSIPTLIHQLIPSNVILGLIYLPSVGILVLSASFIPSLFFSINTDFSLTFNFISIHIKTWFGFSFAFKFRKSD